MLKPFEGAEAHDCVYVIAIDPQLLEHYAFFETSRLRNPIVSKIQLANISYFVKALNGVEIVVS